MVESDFHRLRGLLGEFGRRLGLPGAGETGIVWRKWEDIVGTAVAQHAEPTSLRDGVLRVRTDSPAWAQELTYLARKIVGRANEIAGKEVVTEMKVWTAPGPIRRAREKAPNMAASETDAPSYETPEEAFEAAKAAWQKRREGRRG